eukprot:216760-Amphidinium_carterae.1
MSCPQEKRRGIPVQAVFDCCSLKALSCSTILPHPGFDTATQQHLLSKSCRHVLLEYAFCRSESIPLLINRLQEVCDLPAQRSTINAMRILHKLQSPSTYLLESQTEFKQRKM